jgi:HK97 family phage major capsid protein
MTRKEEIEARKLEIREEVETTEDIEKVEELNKEVETLNEEERKIDEHIENEKAAKEMEEKSFAVKEVVKEEKEMENNKEFRNSKEYINAFAEYIKTNDDKELRALITTGGYATGNSATVEVPDMVYDIVKTAWEREELIQYVKTVSVKGNLKVQFEVSADGATVHTEGNGAVSEESLVLGVVELPAKSIKKWISISDEVLDMRGEDFLRYIYDEITYRIAKKCADELVGIIKALPQSLSANETTGVYDKVSANKISKAPGLGLIAEAIANLSDEATNPIIVMNKLTYAAFKDAQYSANYAVDPFEGLKVVFNNSLPAYSAASANGVYAIVGDFNNGALLNFPNGEGTEMKYDDKTVMEYDLVRILGRRYIGMNAVADKAFVLIAKPSVSA